MNRDVDPSVLELRTNGLSITRLFWEILDFRQLPHLTKCDIDPCAADLGFNYVLSSSSTANEVSVPQSILRNCRLQSPLSLMERVDDAMSTHVSPIPTSVTTPLV